MKWPIDEYGHNWEKEAACSAPQRSPCPSPSHLPRHPKIGVEHRWNRGKIIPPGSVPQETELPPLPEDFTLCGSERDRFGIPELKTSPEVFEEEEFFNHNPQVTSQGQERKVVFETSEEQELRLAEEAKKKEEDHLQYIRKEAYKRARLEQLDNMGDTPMPLSRLPRLKPIPIRASEKEKKYGRKE